MSQSSVDNQKTRNLKWYQNRVKLLRSKPQPIQRSPEWFDLRNKRITASEVASCLTMSEEVCKPYVDDFNIKNFKYKPDKSLSHFDTKEEYVIKKCAAFFGENVFKDSIYTLHGKKYEEIATRLYRRKFKTEVIEFGLLPHSRLNWIGASPDGITPDGVMLEIKCPFSRKIEEGIPPIHYWAQMMLQLEVCDLDRCDFLECEISELESEESYILQDIDENNQDKGILLNKTSEPDNSETKYIYPPDSLNTTDQFIEWKNSTIEEYRLKQVEVVPIYYFISKWFVVHVKRNKEWFLTIKPYLKETFDFIRKLQQDPELFNKYKESIYVLKNKAYLEKYNSTTCLIDTDCELEESDYESDIMDYEVTFNTTNPIHPINETNNTQSNNMNTTCMISDSSSE